MCFRGACGVRFKVRFCEHQRPIEQRRISPENHVLRLSTFPSGNSTFALPVSTSERGLSGLEAIRPTDRPAYTHSALPGRVSHRACARRPRHASDTPNAFVPQPQRASVAHAERSINLIQTVARIHRKRVLKVTQARFRSVHSARAKCDLLTTHEGVSCTFFDCAKSTNDDNS